MSLMYRGHEVQSEDVVVNTVVAGEKGTYRGAAVAFRRAAHFNHRVTPTKQYRGVTY
ncbi:MAG: DUF4278 domain-containing protein [Leptolyngbyaceae bacterium]|nr:DUF4278 domain-containing protein [Leptolyngbyaceae bacterium]